MRTVLLTGLALTLCSPGAAAGAQPKFHDPAIQGYGKVVTLPAAKEPVRKGTKVVFDVTAVPDPDGVIPGLERAAALLNLAADARVGAGDIDVAVVLHGDATKAALGDEAHRKVTGRANPNAELLRRLTAAGAKVYVCGQSMARKGFTPEQILPDIDVAVSALTVTVNKQQDGYAYLPAH